MLEVFVHGAPERSSIGFGLQLAIVNSGLGARACRGSNTARVYVGLLPVVEAFVVVAVPGRVGEVRVPADEPEAVNLDGPGFGLGG